MLVINNPLSGSLNFAYIFDIHYLLILYIYRFSGTIAGAVVGTIIFIVIIVVIIAICKNHNRTRITTIRTPHTGGTTVITQQQQQQGNLNNREYEKIRIISGFKIKLFLEICIYGWYGKQVSGYGSFSLH